MHSGFLSTVMKAPDLSSPRLFFVPVSLNHLTQQYVDWLNDPEVYAYLETGGEYSLEKLEDFLRNVETKEILFWAIHLKSSKKHIGNIKIDPLTERHGLGEYGIMIGERNEWGNGYATEASERIIEFCFSPALNLRKMTLGVVVDNVAAVELYKKLGFNIEGLYLKHTFQKGKYCDVLRMALFNPKYTYGQ